MPTIAIIGAGAIGLSVAWRLLQRGARVHLFDQGAAGRGASWASAGLLAATAGHGGPAGTPLDALCRRGQARWPSFAAELQAASGVDVGLRTEGTLVVARDEAAAHRLRAAFEAWRAAGDDAQRWLTGAAVAAREPALAGTVLAARLCPNDHQVENRRLVAALLAAVRRAGGAVHEGAPAALELGGARPVVRAAGGDVAADVVVLAAGAWSAHVDGLPWRPPVTPLAGQMVALADPPGGAWLRHVVFTPEVYLVPRAGGRLLVGATSEDRGFDDAVTDAGVRGLRGDAARTLPALADAPLADAWAGLRPATPDGAPLLGWVADRVAIAAGHHRNGILLAPVTGDLTADLVLGGPADGLAPFDPARFGR